MIMVNRMTKKDIIDIIVIVIVVALIRTFLFTPAKVKGDSMNDTLIDKEVIIVNKIDYTLNEANRFEIVVFERENGEKLIKRVIGLPGEKVEYKNNVLYINDKEVETPIDFEKTNDFIYEEVEDYAYFVLGDNRDNSVDSRAIGTISKDDIIGTVKLVLFPFNKLGFVK